MYSPDSQSLLHLNDKDGLFPPSFYAATAIGDRTRETFHGTIDAEVGIIGGGYTGLSAALNMAKRGRDVVVLDAHRMGWGASGRNGGQVASGYNRGQGVLEAIMGPQKARDAFAIAVQAARLVKDLIYQYNIPAHFKSGLLYANHRRRFDADSVRYVARLNEDYDYGQIRYVSPEELASMVGTRCYSGATLDMGGGHIHPLNYALGLANAAENAGARLFDRSEVLGVKGDNPHLLSTVTGTLRVKTLIYACNGYLGRLEPRIAAKVMPINSFMVATEPLGAAQARSLIRDDVAVADSRFVVRYFRLSHDNRLLFGGREAYSYRFNRQLKRFAAVPMVRTFPQLRDVRIDYGWGGTLGITRSRLPDFAQLGPHTYSLSGYSGSGIAMATMAGKIMADTLDGNRQNFDTMATMPTKPFPGGMAMRKPLLFTAMHGYALRDRF